MSKFAEFKEFIAPKQQAYRSNLLKREKRDPNEIAKKFCDKLRKSNYRADRSGDCVYKPEIVIYFVDPLVKPELNKLYDFEDVSEKIGLIKTVNIDDDIKALKKKYEGRLFAFRNFYAKLDGMGDDVDPQPGNDPTPPPPPTVLTADPNMGGEWYATCSLNLDFDFDPPSDDYIVAVIDTGADLFHLRNHGILWRESTSNENVGFNAFATCLSTNSPSSNPGMRSQLLPWDDNGHGTGVASTIHRVITRKLGKESKPKFKILPVKAFDYNGVSTVLHLMKAFEYLANYKHDFINASWHISADTAGAADLKVFVDSLGFKIICAAGNNGFDLKKCSYFPSSDYNSPNIVTVGANTLADPFSGLHIKVLELAEFSNYVSDQKIVTAPGVTVPCMYPTYGHHLWWAAYSHRNGTSFAAPFVSGAYILYLLGEFIPQEFTKIKLL